MNAESYSLRWLTALLVSCFFILCLCGLPAVFTDPIPRDVMPMFFYLGMYFAQNILFVFILGLILFPVFYFVRSDAWKIGLSFPLVATALAFSFMNAKVFAFWRLFVNGALLSMYFSKGGGSQIFEVHSGTYFWIVGISVLFIVVSAFVIWVSKQVADFVRLRPWLLSFAAIYAIFQIGFFYLSYQDNMRFLQYAVKVPYFYDLSWVRVAEKLGVNVFPKQSETKALQRFFAANQRLTYPLHPLQYHLPKHPLNVLVIMVDTLRYDMVNSRNMPAVAGFAKHASRFLDNLSGGDCTQPGVFSFFYGIPASYWDSALTHHQESILIRAFQANRYHLGVFASASLLSPAFSRTVFADVPHLQTMTKGETALDRDHTITREMKAFLNKQAKTHHRFFGFMFYDAPHAYNALPLRKPFSPIGFINYFNVNENTPAQPFFNLYQNAVLKDDQMIASVLKTLRDDHLMHNTVVIFTADHGQEFNDYHNDYWEHASGFSKYQVRTPLLVAWPNRPAQVFHNQTTHFDITPTLLRGVLGVKNKERDYSIGHDLFSNKQLRSILVGNYGYYAWITPKLVIQFHNSGLYRFTDLKMGPLKERVIPKSLRIKINKEVTMYYH